MERAAAVGENWIFTTLQKLSRSCATSGFAAKYMVNSRKLTGAGGLPLAENDKSDGPSQRGVYNDQGALRDAAGSLPVQVSAPKTQPAAQNAAAEHAEKATTEKAAVEQDAPAASSSGQEEGKLEANALH
jgi:hypothetical protein